MDHLSRRDFLAGLASAGAAALVPWPAGFDRPPMFLISLAQWSLHQELQARQLDHLDFAKVAREEFGLEAIEYVNSFFKDRARDAAYLAEMNRRAADQGVYQHLIMVDAEGDLGDPEPVKRSLTANTIRKMPDTIKKIAIRSVNWTAACTG